MGPVTILYIAFASILLFICFITLYISYKRKGDLLFPAMAVLSGTAVLYFGIQIFCSSVMGMNCNVSIQSRITLIISNALSLAILGVLYHQLDINKKAYIFFNSLIFWALILLSLFLPDRYLFGEDFSIRTIELSAGDSFKVIETGWTAWRIILDLNILFLAVSCIILLMKKLETILFRNLVIIFSGIGIILLASLWDQMVDMGQITQAYMMPFAYFVLSMVIMFLPMFNHIKEVYDNRNLIDLGANWQKFIDEAEFIVVGLNRMGHIEFVNKYFYTLTSFKQEEVIGNDWFEFFIPPEVNYNVQGTFVEVLSSEFHPHYVNPILTKFKEERMISWYNIRTRNQAGIITGSLSLGIDITDDVMEKESLRKKLKDAEKIIHMLKDKIDLS